MSRSLRSELVYALGKVDAGSRSPRRPTAVEALRELAGAAYDVVFLDINLPRLTGLEATKVINALPSPPHVVFVTAHDAHALDAFDLAAFNYVVKPVSQARLAQTVGRLRALRPHAASAAPPADAPPSRVALEDGERTRLVKIAGNPLRAGERARRDRARVRRRPAVEGLARRSGGALRTGGILARAPRVSGESRARGRSGTVFRRLVSAARRRQGAQRGARVAELSAGGAQGARIVICHAEPVEACATISAIVHDRGAPFDKLRVTFGVRGALGAHASVDTLVRFYGGGGFQGFACDECAQVAFDQREDAARGDVAAVAGDVRRDQRVGSVHSGSSGGNGSGSVTSRPVAAQPAFE